MCLARQWGRTNLAPERGSDREGSRFYYHHIPPAALYYYSPRRRRDPLPIHTLLHSVRWNRNRTELSAKICQRHFPIQRKEQILYPRIYRWLFASILETERSARWLPHSQLFSRRCRRLCRFVLFPTHDYSVRRLWSQENQINKIVNYYVE